MNNNQHFTPLTPTYNDIHNMCYTIAQTLREMQMEFGIIVGLARGGLIPAIMLSHMMNLPVIPAHYSSKNGRGDDKNHDNVLPYIPQNKTILLVDDIVDSGYTMREIVDLYERRGNSIYTATLYYKALAAPPIVPMIRCQTIPHDSGWCIFPWERPTVIT